MIQPVRALRMHERVGHGAKDVHFWNYRALKFLRNVLEMVFSESDHIALKRLVLTGMTL